MSRRRSIYRCQSDVRQAFSLYLFYPNTVPALNEGGDKEYRETKEYKTWIIIVPKLAPRKPRTKSCFISFDIYIGRTSNTGLVEVLYTSKLASRSYTI